LFLSFIIMLKYFLMVARYYFTLWVISITLVVVLMISNNQIIHTSTFISADCLHYNPGQVRQTLVADWQSSLLDHGTLPLALYPTELRGESQCQSA